MEAYTGFAEVYDIFMDETPYEEWALFLTELIEAYGVSRPERKEGTKGFSEAKEPRGFSESEENAGEGTVSERSEKLSAEKNLVVDLGCGTGTMAELLCQKGYDVIGIDNSEEMLGIAMEKRRRSGSDILYLCQDMREMDLYSTAGTIVSVCDSLNYLLEDEDVEATFSLVNTYLYPGGIFIFDFNTVYKYETVIGDTTIAENRDTCSFIWENFYHEEERINEYDLTIFVKEESESERERFLKFQETHLQRGYTLEEMENFVRRAGMELVLSLDADTHKEPVRESERIYMVARECRKQG